jgi:hypothetical protein
MCRTTDEFKAADFTPESPRLDGPAKPELPHAAGAA